MFLFIENVILRTTANVKIRRKTYFSGFLLYIESLKNQNNPKSVQNDSNGHVFKNTDYAGPQNRMKIDFPIFNDFQKNTFFRFTKNNPRKTTKKHVFLFEKFNLKGWDENEVIFSDMGVGLFYLPTV